MSGSAAPIRVIALPYAGASAVCYHGLAEALPRHIELITHELPGHGARIREPLRRRMAPLVHDVLERQRPQLRTPYALYGHSFGAWLACDIAHALVERGLSPPSHLLLSGRRAPRSRALHPDAHSLPRKDFFAMLQRMGGFPPAISEDPELVDLFEPVLRADFEVLETRRTVARPPLDVPIHLMLGRADDVTPEQAERWQDETLRRLTIEHFDGDHFFIHDQVSAMARVFERHLCDPAPEEISLPAAG